MKFKNSAIIIGGLIGMIGLLPFLIWSAIYIARGVSDFYVLFLLIASGALSLAIFGVLIYSLCESYYIDEREVIKRICGKTILCIKKSDIKDIVLVKHNGFGNKVYVLSKSVADDKIEIAKKMSSTLAKNNFLNRDKNIISLMFTPKIIGLLHRYNYYITTEI